MYFLIIVGARGLGRVLLSLARGDVAHNSVWTVLGFLDTAGPSILSPDCDVPVIGDPLTYVPHPREIFVVGIGDPFEKQKYIAPLLEKGAQFVEFLGGTRLGERTKIGKSVVFGMDVTVSTDCQLDDFVFVDGGTTIGHDVGIGAYSHIGPRCFIGGNAKIGRYVTIHPMAGISRGVSIGEGAVIGARSYCETFRLIRPSSAIQPGSLGGHRWLRRKTSFLGYPAKRQERFDFAQGQINPRCCLRVAE
ncbi:MAG: hypothetical protein WDN29_08260 [Methylovirgula sp.]